MSKNEGDKTKKSKKEHVSYYSKKSKLLFCRNCGLVYLKNAATQKALRETCPDNVWPVDF